MDQEGQYCGGQAIFFLLTEGDMGGGGGVDVIWWVSDAGLSDGQWRAILFHQ